MKNIFGAMLRYEYENVNRVKRNETANIDPLKKLVKHGLEAPKPRDFSTFYTALNQYYPNIWNKEKTQVEKGYFNLQIELDLPYIVS